MLSPGSLVSCTRPMVLLSCRPNTINHMLYNHIIESLRAEAILDVAAGDINIFKKINDPVEEIEAGSAFIYLGKSSIYYRQSVYGDDVPVHLIMWGTKVACIVKTDVWLNDAFVTLIDNY